jgi:hypothetical protein
MSIGIRINTRVMDVVYKRVWSHGQQHVCGRVANLVFARVRDRVSHRVCNSVDDRIFDLAWGRAFDEING